MFVTLSFIGKLPSYIIECVHQIRTYFDGDIYLILNDFNSEYIEKLEKYNIILVNYEIVKSNEFLEIVNKYKHKFEIVPGLIGREELFIRSFERFYLVSNLMKKDNLNDCLFLELDNLIYEDPRNWFQIFNKKLGIMYDNDERYSSGIMLIKDSKSLDKFLQYCLYFIQNSTKFINEMTALSEYYYNNIDDVEILPVYWNDSKVSIQAHQNFKKYNETIFDAAAIGINLLGMDPYHTRGVIVKNKKNPISAIDYTQLKFEWKMNDNGKRPYVWYGERWILINNLHVHSKDLLSGLSKPL